MNTNIIIYNGWGNISRKDNKSFKDLYDVVTYACQLIKFGEVYNFKIMDDTNDTLIYINAYLNKGYGVCIENGMFYLASRTETYNDLWDRFYDKGAGICKVINKYSK